MDVDTFLKGSGALTINAVRKKVKASCITIASAKKHTCMMMPMSATFMQDICLMITMECQEGHAEGVHIGVSNALHRIDLTIRVAKPVAYFTNASVQNLP